MSLGLAGVLEVMQGLVLHCVGGGLCLHPWVGLVFPVPVDVVPDSLRLVSPPRPLLSQVDHLCECHLASQQLA